jgi:hypothetical protein
LPGDELAFANARFRVYLGPDEPEPERRPERTEMMTSFPEPEVANDDSFDDEAVAGLGSESDVRLIGDD